MHATRKIWMTKEVNKWINHCFIQRFICLGQREFTLEFCDSWKWFHDVLDVNRNILSRGPIFFFIRTNQIVVLYIDSSFLLLHIFPGTDKILSRFVTHWIVMEIFPFPQKKGIQRQCNAKILDRKFEMFLITYLLNEKDRFGSKIKVECKFCST